MRYHVLHQLEAEGLLEQRVARRVRPLAEPVSRLPGEHVASARTMRDSLDALVTYDGRMIEAGRMAGLRVAPGVRSE